MFEQAERSVVRLQFVARDPCASHLPFWAVRTEEPYTKGVSMAIKTPKWMV